MDHAFGPSPVVGDLRLVLQRAHARARVASALHDVMSDALDPELAARGCPDQAVLDRVLGEALNAAADAALEALVQGVSPAFEACDPLDLERLTLGRRWRELGW